MPRNPLRTVFQRLGIDLHRHQPEADRMAWLSSLGIRTIFDIGANVGQFATEIRAALPDAQIYSFEPLQECYGKLVTAFRNDPNFKAFNCALGETTGSMSMNKSSYTPSSSLRAMAESHKQLFPHTKDNTPEQISIRMLDEVFAELKLAKDILIKVDTQGYEDKVIAGGTKTFPQAKVVFIEASFIQLYENQPLFDDIYQKLKSFGFRYDGALHQKIDKKTGKVIFEDAIFVR